MNPSAASVRRYANTLVELAKEQSLTETVRRDMSVLQETLHQNAELETVFSAPTIDNRKKIDIFKEIFESLHPLVHKTVALLASNNRMPLIKVFAEEALRIIDVQEGILKGTIITSVPIDERVKQSIQKKISADCEKSVYLENEVDPSLLGGFLVKIGDTQYDASISGKLNNIKTKLLS